MNRLTLRHAFALVLPVLIAAATAAHAQSPWPAGPSAAGTAAQSPWPADPSAAGTAVQAPWPASPPAADAAASPFDQPAAPFGQPQQQEPPCLKAFAPLRDDAAKKAHAIQQASARKASAQEACGLFNIFVAAELKMIKYAQANAAGCGIPAQAINEMKSSHEQAIQIRTKVCQAAKMQRQGPPGPSLGDALGASQVPDASNVKPGRGTFDTLTGTPLGNAK
jgi:hypothetical protein